MASEVSLSTGPGATRRGRRHADRDPGPRWDVPRATTPGHQRYAVAVLLTDGKEPTALGGPLFRRLRTLLRERVRTTRNLTEIDLWLQSPGGDAHAAYKIALLLRSYASVLRVVIPDHAKGAATLLALAADEIYLAPAAELGPLDTMIESHVGGVRLSARDVLRSVDQVSQSALAFALRSADAVRESSDLSRLDCLDVAVRLAAELHQPLARQIHPVDVVAARNLLDTASRYADVLLAMRNPAPAGEEQPELDPETLITDYPTQRFVIDIDEAKEIGLPVHPLWKYPAAEAVQALHEFVEERDTATVEVRASEIDLRSVPMVVDVDREAERSVERVAENPVERLVERGSERLVERVLDRDVEANRDEVEDDEEEETPAELSTAAAPSPVEWSATAPEAGTTRTGTTYPYIAGD